MDISQMGKSSVQGKSDWVGSHFETEWPDFDLRVFCQIRVNYFEEAIHMRRELVILTRGYRKCALIDDSQETTKQKGKKSQRT
jgi:hypothetical protein